MALYSSNNTTSGPARTSSDPVDKEIDDRLRDPFRLRPGDAPARKMTVDVHSGKAIDQRAAGNLNRFQVGGAELALRECLGQRPFGQFNQFGIVSRNARVPVVVKKAAAGDN